MEAILPAGPDDVIAGVRARFVARPQTTEEAAAVVREAVERNLTIVARGTAPSSTGRYHRTVWTSSSTRAPCAGSPSTRPAT